MPDSTYIRKCGRFLPQPPIIHPPRLPHGTQASTRLANIQGVSYQIRCFARCSPLLIRGISFQTTGLPLSRGCTMVAYRFADCCRQFLNIWNLTTSREPAPTRKHARISIGDVGFIRRGQFHLLFSAGSPLGERQPGDDVPSTFEELTVGIPESSEPRQPGCLRTDTVREFGAGVGASVSTPLYVLSHKPTSTHFKMYHPAPWNLAQISHSSSLGIVVQH